MADAPPDAGSALALGLRWDRIEPVLALQPLAEWVVLGPVGGVIQPAQDPGLRQLGRVPKRFQQTVLKIEGVDQLAAQLLDRELVDLVLVDMLAHRLTQRPSVRQSTGDMQPRHGIARPDR